jgi:hypothetical protein
VRVDEDAADSGTGVTPYLFRLFARSDVGCVAAAPRPSTTRGGDLDRRNVVIP